MEPGAAHFVIDEPLCLLRAGMMHRGGSGLVPARGTRGDLTVAQLGLTGALHRSLRTTNLIESLNSSIETYTPQRQALAGRGNGSALGEHRVARCGEVASSGAGLSRPSPARHRPGYPLTEVTETARVA